MVGMPMTSNEELTQWVAAVATLTEPDSIYWCTGNQEEQSQLTQKMLASGEFLSLNPKTHPNCYLHRSHPSDVARTEHLTFICTPNRDDAGPNNNWMPPDEGHRKADALFKGCMRGRVMYVIPYCMGPLDSPYSRCGVELTDSAYVVVNMKIMTRMGEQALRRIERDKVFVKGLHSNGDLKVEHRMIAHFPEELMIKSIGSGYGGNALLGKKCHSLRIASYQGRKEGWLAEHMLILGIETPSQERHYVAAAFPSACGKTNLAMLIPPDRYRLQPVSTGFPFHRSRHDSFLQEQLFACRIRPAFFGPPWDLHRLGARQSRHLVTLPVPDYSLLDHLRS
jgi:phosphoenolpyruvate carboxykinase (GTP)